MNWDQLEGLVKLANNNPNENEANAAARKVCSVLLALKNVKNPLDQIRAQPYSYYSVDWDLVEQWIRSKDNE